MRALPVVVVTLLLSGCGAAGETRAPAAGETVSGHGLELALPDGWHGDVTKLGPHHAATLRAATFPLEPLTDVGRRAQETMDAGDLLLVVADYGAVPADGQPAPATLPIRVAAEDVVSFEGFKRPVATTSVVVAGATLQVWVVTAQAPTAAQLERANAVLATLRVERARWRAHADDARGFSASIPPGWAVAGERLTPLLDDPTEILSVGTGPFRPGGDRCAHVPEHTLEALGPADALVTVVEFAAPADRGLPPRPADLIAAEAWEPEARDCLDEPGRLDYRVLPFTDGGRGFYAYVAFGEAVTEETRREAGRLLDSLRFERAGDISFADPEVGVSGRHPAGWSRARALTRFTDPREVLVLATYPLRDGAKAGECAPDTARADMPADGVFIWLLEYLSGVPESRFSERPADFRLAREDIHANVSCFSGFGHSTTFRAAGRAFQLLVAFGGRPSEEQLHEVERILNALVLERLPSPPYSGWPLLTGSTPDSMYSPPDWPAAAARFSPAAEPRPRTLFYAANRRLFGLPAPLQTTPQELPAPMPSAALANGFPADGVLLWVVEEGDPRTLARQFPPIDRDWPRRDDFGPTEISTKPAPELRWLVAAGAFRGHRFSVWIARGPKATEADLGLALKAAASLAVSGCDRGVGERCEETR